MQGELVTRRTQFSSCDECRRSRVACDAAARAKEKEDGDADPSSVSCSRCLNRRKQCTFKWVKENKGTTTKKPSKRKSRRKQPSPSASEQESSQHNETQDTSAATLPPYRSPNPSDLSSPFVTNGRDDTERNSLPMGFASDMALSPSVSGLGPMSSDIISAADAQWLSTIYRVGFDTVFGSWMGKFCCPFVYGEHSTADKYVRISDLCRQLDWCRAYGITGDPQDLISQGIQQTERCRQADESLRIAIASFSARWLPLAPKTSARDGDDSAVIQALWRHARRDMLRVINRPSYRSMLSLFLFALTPVPATISEEEEIDGISGQSCVHAALQQIQVLRAWQRNLQFSGTSVAQGAVKQALPANPDSMNTSSFLNAESTAYWAALTFDTSASLTLNCRSLLSSGLFGFDEELSWNLVRTCAKMFEETAQQWQSGSVDMTDDRANQIVGAGAAWKLLGWKLTAVFKESLRDGHDETKVAQAYTAVVDSIKNFNIIFSPHMEACQRRMQFLGQQTKLRWYSLMLHYHLSILMLIDMIEATERYDLLHDLEQVKVEAENTVMNTLVFGLHTTYTLSGDPLAFSEDGANLSKDSITIPLTAIDPYPHHIVAGVQLVRKAIERDFGLGKITEESHSNLQSTLVRTLDLLPQSSKSVQAARSRLSERPPDISMDHYHDPYRSIHVQFAA